MFILNEHNDVLDKYKSIANNLVIVVIRHLLQ